MSLNIDWRGFGRTRGGWFDHYGSVKTPTRPKGPYKIGPIIRISSEVAPRWEPWRSWSPPSPTLDEARRFAEMWPADSRPQGGTPG